MVRVEAYGTKQKKTCFNCGSMISFLNGDIKESEKGKYIECPVCGKKIKAHLVDRYSKPKKKRETEFGRKMREAMNATEWDGEKENDNS